MKTVAVLFTHPRSHYLELPECDFWPATRDARNYRGPLPVIAHPPCRMWSRARRRGLPLNSEEMALGPWAVEMVRTFGGVLEHPFCSRLWPHLHLPKPGHSDAWGFTVQIDQSWFGHASEKATWLYVCGVEPETLPPVTVRLGRRLVNFNLLGRAARQLTPPELCRYLVRVASIAEDSTPF